MTVASNTNRARWLGAGSAGPFTFDFRFVRNSEIQVVRVSASGDETPLVEGVDYTLAGAGSFVGGALILDSVLVEGEELVAVRTIDLTQPTSIRNQGAFFPEIHEEVFDRLVMLIQQVSEATDRAIKMPISQPGPFTMPGESRANTIVGFDANGDPELKTASYSITTHQVVAATVIVDADASVGPVTVNLPASGEILITKTDETANKVIPATTDGKTILLGAGIELTGQGQFIRLRESNGNWWRS